MEFAPCTQVNFISVQQIFSDSAAESVGLTCPWCYLEILSITVSFASYLLQCCPHALQIGKESEQYSDLGNNEVHSFLTKWFWIE